MYTHKRIRVRVFIRWKERNIAKRRERNSEGTGREVKREPEGKRE